MGPSFTTTTLKVTGAKATAGFGDAPKTVNLKSAVLPAGVPRIAVEMGSTDGWWKYGVSAVVGIDTYGESAPAPVLFKHFGFTPENVADTVQAALQKFA
jgi:transketolase